MNPDIRKTLLIMVFAYFGIVFVLMFMVIRFQPGWVQYLPIGGMVDLQTITSLTGEGGLTEEMMKVGQEKGALKNGLNLMTAMIGTLIMMLPLRQIYISVNSGNTHNPDIAISLLVLPLIVTAIVYIVKFSLPLAFALAGIFAGVRYRTTLKNQADAYFTFASVGVGLAAGTRSLGIAFVLAFFFSLTVLAATPNNEERS